MTKTTTIRVELPYHLQTLARCRAEVSLEISTPATTDRLLDALEARYPMLCGTIRDHVTKRRRPFVRYFGCQRDLSHDPTDLPLPAAIESGIEPFIVWGALSGG